MPLSPPHCRPKMKEMLWNTGERQVISEAWLWIIYIPHKGSTSSQTQLHGRIPAFSSKSTKAPFRHPLTNSPHNEQFYLQLFNLTLLYPTLLQPTLHTLNSTCGISPKSEPSHKPSEAGSMPRHGVDAHATQSVQPQGLTSRRKADGQNTEHGQLGLFARFFKDQFRIAAWELYK